MELPWSIKLRIAAVIAFGAVLGGFLSFGLLGPADEFLPICLVSGGISVLDIIVYAVIALGVSFVSYFISYPYGVKIAPLAVPAGLSVIALKGGTITALLQLNQTAAQKKSIYSALAPEAVLWLAILLISLGAVHLAEKLVKKQKGSLGAIFGHKPFKNKILAIVGSIAGAAIIANFALGVFVRDVSAADVKLGQVVGQAAAGQICFGVITAFGLAAFAVKIFIGTKYYWTVIAAVIISVLSASSAGSEDVAVHLSQNWPVGFFAGAASAITPLQMVAYGAFGAIAGYWGGVKYQCWRKQ